MLSKKAVRRLTKLIEYMESLPREAHEHFNMGMWFYHDGVDHDHNISGDITRKHLNKCGTVACALGWAATVPEFRRAGLVMTSSLGTPELRDMTTGMSGPWGAAAAAEFFDIGLEQAIYLFGGRTGPRAGINTQKQWARFARRALRKWRKE